MATIQSLVESRTLAIDHSDFVDTGDKVFVAGHFYSDKPPLPALLGAVVYAPLNALGFRLHPGTSICYFLITLATVSIAWLCGTLALLSSLEFTGLTVDNRLLLALAAALGTSLLTWATTFNNHEIAAGSISVGFMYILKARFEGGVRNLAAAGFFLSLAAASDIPTTAFFVFFGAYVIAMPGLRHNFRWFVLPLLLTAVPTAIVDFAIHGNITPVQIYPEYFNYPGSPWIGTSELSGVKLNSLGFACAYAFRSLFGPSGFLLYNPFALLALVGCVREIKRCGVFAREALCVLSSCVVLCAYYWATTTNFGGRSYSIRWFVPLLPPLLFFLFPFFQTMTARRRQVVIGVLAVSIVIALVGALNPWSALATSNIPFVDNIREFFTHLPPGFSM